MIGSGVGLEEGGAGGGERWGEVGDVAGGSWFVEIVRLAFMRLVFVSSISKSPF